MKFSREETVQLLEEPNQKAAFLAVDGGRRGSRDRGVLSVACALPVATALRAASASIAARHLGFGD